MPSNASNKGDSANSDRLTKLQLRLGGEQFDLISLSASEGLSQPFFFVVDVISKLGSFDLLPHLGKPALIESLADGRHLRYFHGIITDGQLVGEAITGIGRAEQGEYHYQLTLQPKSHFHSFGRDNRIFQDMSVRDIIKDVLSRRKIDFDEKLQGQAPSRILKYCVQFGESDTNFISRLMEEHGIYYYYRHEAARHVMVLCDNANAHKAVECGQLKYHPHSGAIGNSHSMGRGDGTQAITAWQEYLRSGGEMTSVYRDYDFMKPASKIEGEYSGRAQHESDDIEFYNWPGRFYANPQGKNLAEILLESRRAQRISYRGSTGCTEVRVGSTFKLTDHPTKRFNREFMVISAHTTLADEAHVSGTGGGVTEVQFTAIPSDVHYRAPVITPRPIARGPETAVVVGPKGEEIHVDKYGRIKIHFHWDRLGEMNEKASCWVRVSQTGGLGNIIIPRIGHEVLVDFLNGDPDRPIVVGRVFNDQTMPVYTLPEHKTRAVWRSKTYQRTESNTPGDAKQVEGNKPAANEIRFEDKTGSEEFYIHAEKDLNTVIRYRETHLVGLDQTINIGRNDKITIGKDREEEVADNETIKIGKDRSEKVGQNEKIDIGINREENVGKNETVSVGSNRVVRIGTDDELNIGSNLKITAGNSIEIKAGTKITLQVGASKMEMTTSSIKISSVTIDINGQAQTKVNGGAQIELTGGALAKLAAAIVKIN